MKVLPAFDWSSWTPSAELEHLFGQFGLVNRVGFTW